MLPLSQRRSNNRMIIFRPDGSGKATLARRRVDLSDAADFSDFLADKHITTRLTNK